MLKKNEVGLNAHIGDRDGAASDLPLVELRGISKNYGDLVANDGIDLAIRRGEIHALLGENGAGKSTLVKILYGIVGQSDGDILWEGKPVVMTTPVKARSLGIGMVFQHFSLFDDLTVAENIAVALGKDWTLQDVRSEIGKCSRRKPYICSGPRVAGEADTPLCDPCSAVHAPAWQAAICR